MRTGCHYLFGLSVSLCVTFVGFTVCEGCTRPICTNRGSMEVGEYGLTRGTCFLACRLELDAVVGLLWISGCVPRLADYSVFFVFDLFFLRTHTGWCMYEATSCLLYVSTGTEARPKERSDRGRFVPIGKKDSSYRGVYRVPLFNWSVCPSVCLSVCV